MTAAATLTRAQIDHLAQVVADPLTTGQVAALAHICPGHVRDWTRRHGITGVLARRPRVRWLYPGAQVRAVIAAARTPTPAVIQWAELRRLHRMTVRARAGVL